MKMEDGNKRLVWSLEKRVLSIMRRFLYLSFKWHGNLIKQLDYHPLSLSRFIARRRFRVIDETEAISTCSHKYIYILREWLRGLYFTATNLLRLIDRRILTNLAFYRNFNKPCCLSSTRRLFTRLARDNLKLACPKRPSLLLIWTVAPRLNQVWR